MSRYNSRDSRDDGGNKSYPDSGLIFPSKEKRGENSPDFWGRIEFSEESIRALAGMLRDGKTPELKASLWRRSNDKGAYLKIAIRAEDDEDADRGRGRGERRVAQSSRGRQDTRNDSRNNSRDESLFDDDIPF